MAGLQAVRERDIFSPPKGPLFKYRAVSDDAALGRLEEILLASRIFMPRMEQLNDPFEGKAHSDFNSSPQQVEAYWRARGADLPVAGDIESAVQLLVRGAQDPNVTSQLQERLQRTLADTGVFCLADTELSIPMWSYYADSHSGVCVRFRNDRDFISWALSQGVLLPVQYSPTYPAFKFYETPDDKKAILMVGTKSLEWIHEQEWRIANTSRSGVMEFPPELVDGIVLGARIGQETRASVLEMVRKRPVRTEVLEAQLKDREFALTVTHVPLA